MSGLRVGLHSHHDEISEVSVGNERLLTVDHVAVPVPNRLGPDGRQTRTCVGFRETNGGDNFSGGATGKPAVLGGLGAITNKDRLCEERTTILSIGWTSPAREQWSYI